VSDSLKEIKKQENNPNLENFCFFNEAMLTVLNENKRESQKPNPLAALRNFVKPWDHISEQVKNLNEDQELKTMFRMGLDFHEIELRVIGSLSTLPRETLEILAEKHGSFESVYRQDINPLQEFIESSS
tara:strand:+ start:230 stop:616 length:387 start_codon:yes stop_codon:yes gene_type:complete